MPRSKLNGLISHPGRNSITPSCFLLNKPGKNSAKWVSWLERRLIHATYLCIGSVDVSDGLTTNLKWDCFFHLSKSYHQKFFAFSVYLCTSFTVYVTVTTKPEPSHLLSHLKKKTFMAYSDKSSWHTFPSLGGRQPFTRHTWQKSCN